MAGTRAEHQRNSDDTIECIRRHEMLVRGFGLRLISIILTTAAYRLIPRESIPEGTTVLSIISRIGGTTFTALLAVVLQKRILTHDPSAPASVLSSKVTEQVATELAQAFGQTFIVLTGMVALSAVPVLLLHAELRRDQSASALSVCRKILDVSAGEAWLCLGVPDCDHRVERDSSPSRTAPHS
jgi:hypothetical protein